MMYPPNVHADHPGDVLTYCSLLAVTLRSWAWAMSAFDAAIGTNLDPEDFEGIATIAEMLFTTLRDAERHMHRVCACFTGAPEPATPHRRA
jgi:hypothetical protein